MLFLNCKSTCETTKGDRYCTNAFNIDSPAADAGLNWCIGCQADKVRLYAHVLLQLVPLLVLLLTLLYVQQIPSALYRSGYRGNILALTTSCKSDGTDAPYMCCVGSRLPQIGGQAYAKGGQWQGNGKHFTEVPSLYAQQLKERIGPAPAPAPPPALAPPSPGTPTPTPAATSDALATGPLALLLALLALAQFV